MATISLKLELLNPTEHMKIMYQKMTVLNTNFSNFLLEHEDLSKVTSKDYTVFSSDKLPSAIVNQTIREVKLKKKKQKAQKFRRFWCGFNSQNFKIEHENELYKISFPTLENRVSVPVVVEIYQQNWLDRILSGQAKQGVAELLEKKGRWFISISIYYEPEKPKVALMEPKIMGIDVGMNYLAVASIGTNALFFNGAEAAYVRRTYATKRRILEQSKKIHALRKSNNKELQWMQDVNHKMSRQIIDFAMKNGVQLVRMEDLTGIINTAKSKKEAGRNLHAWPHYQLQQFIDYKAKKAGIDVEYVKPTNTSITCKCGHVSKDNRKRHVFKCTKCHYTSHSDVNAAINIAKAISGV